MADFDPIKAIREEISGLADVQKSLRARERIAEETIGRAESELNDLRKLRGFADIELQRKREVLRALEAKANE